jgi:hypothetical protein
LAQVAVIKLLTNSLHNVTAAIDVNDLSGDVIVLDEKNNRVHNVSRTSCALQQSTLDCSLLLLIGVSIGKQNGPRRHTIYLDRRRIRFRQAAIDSNQRRFGNTVGEIAGQMIFPAASTMLTIFPAWPSPLRIIICAADLRHKKWRTGIRIQLGVPFRRSCFACGTRVEYRCAVNENVESTKLSIEL